jgi:hypothetical protein
MSLDQARCSPAQDSDLGKEPDASGEGRRIEDCEELGSRAACNLRFAEVQ